jgi:regulator of protease activity HflC (stomatin/prohibitin superfamily)
MNRQSSTPSFVKENLGKGIFILSSLIGFLIFFNFFIGSNNDASWVVVQYPWGSVSVIDSAGWYLRFGNSYWSYPRNFQVEYDDQWSFKVVFNDGGSALMNAMVRFSSPYTIEDKRKFHQLFGGNGDAVEAAVWAHLSDAMKSSGPVMSASEHQSARRGEFTSLVQDQLQKGLFEMKRVSRTLQDQYDDKGKPITVYATEVVFEDNGIQKICRTSPLTDFALIITQFSITDVSYDEQTQRQFSQKKEAFLSAEGSKAQREKEVQERLMVEERGRREKAEVEAKALKMKAEAVINAQREKEVEELNAARRLAVAQLTKQEAETKAMQELEVARLDKSKAIEQAEAQIILAQATEKALSIAGALSEKERILAQIEMEKAIGVAQHLSKIHVPSVIMNGSGEENSKGDTLMNLVLLRSMGIVK